MGGGNEQKRCETFPPGQSVKTEKGNTLSGWHATEVAMHSC